MTKENEAIKWAKETADHCNKSHFNPDHHHKFCEIAKYFLTIHKELLTVKEDECI